MIFYIEIVEKRGQCSIANAIRTQKHNLRFFIIERGRRVFRVSSITIPRSATPGHVMWSTGLPVGPDFPGFVIFDLFQTICDRYSWN